jgi:hypothetical protein
MSNISSVIPPPTYVPPAPAARPPRTSETNYHRDTHPKPAPTNATGRFVNLSA